MNYIYQRAEWPRFSWQDAVMSKLLPDVHLRRGRLLGRMGEIGFDLQQEANLRVLTQDVVKTSAIEGEILDPLSVRSSIGRRLGIDVAGATPSSRSVDGVVEMLLDATRKCDAPITSERLFTWHSGLFSERTPYNEKLTIGAWRPVEKDPMQVVSGAFGRERIHFEAPSGSDVPLQMEAFIRWMNSTVNSDPVIRAAIAHLYFVTIHPFEDGNGRISRALSDMALASGEKGAPRFYSLSAQIESERSDYYEMLEQTQKGTTDITEWLDWFSSCCGRALTKAEAELDSVLKISKAWAQINTHPVNERQKLILNKLLNGFEGKLSSPKYATIANCSEDTALRDIKELMAFGIVEAYPGGGRSTRYRLAELPAVTKVTSLTPPNCDEPSSGDSAAAHSTGRY